MTADKSVNFLKEKNERLKLWAGLITLIVTNAVTLITAITAHINANDEVKAKAAYKELSVAISEISKDNIKIHNDVANLRGYISGLSQSGVLEKPPEIIKSRSIPLLPVKPVKPVEPPNISEKPRLYTPPPLGSL